MPHSIFINSCWKFHVFIIIFFNLEYLCCAAQCMDCPITSEPSNSLTSLPFLVTLHLFLHKVCYVRNCMYKMLDFYSQHGDDVESEATLGALQRCSYPPSLPPCVLTIKINAKQNCNKNHNFQVSQKPGTLMMQKRRWSVKFSPATKQNPFPFPEVCCAISFRVSDNFSVKLVWGS